MQPFLSIILPVYNSKKYLTECVKSITSQTFTNFELIIVDDGSTDGSAELCDSFASDDYRIKVIHQANQGVWAARNNGINAASGQYIGFADSDDSLGADMYKTMVFCAMEHGCDAVICDITAESGTSSSVISGMSIGRDGYYSADELKKEIFPFMMYSGKFFEFGIAPVLWNKIFRRSVLCRDNVILEVKIGEDAACTYPSLMNCSNLYYLKGHAFYRYRIHESQTTMRYCAGLPEQLEKLYSYFQSTQIAKKFPEQLDYYFAYMTKIAISNELNPANSAAYADKIAAIRGIIKSAKARGIIKRISLKNMPPIHKLYFVLVKLGFARILARLIQITKKVKNKKTSDISEKIA